MSLVLYQFPLSHFCEKVRWALDFKGVEYRTKNLLPGMHAKTTKKIGGQSSVPVLEHNGRYIQGSGKIISYLDEQFPTKRLTPVNSQEAQAALEWERYLDEEIGVHIRRYMYNVLLRHPSLVTGFLATGGPFWAKPFLLVIFPVLSKKMRQLMKINAANAGLSKQHLHKALKRMNESLSGKKFLVGDRFSRADLTAAALLAPLFMPPKYGLKWPNRLPEPLASEVNAIAPQLDWAKSIYSKYR